MEQVKSGHPAMIHADIETLVQELHQLVCSSKPVERQSRDRFAEEEKPCLVVKGR